ncbi:MAG: class I SAM-dependent methyltransferase [Oscillospiraceae bacterium]|nr:class I SAM-dependent methyltransferase [Oscillospiraceae bacterium]
MRDIELVKQWKAEEQFAFQGWDFSHIDGRWECPEPPWDYRSIVKSYLKDTDILLDMGTGGGEVLLTINHPYRNTYATEAYVPNYELCKKVLSPLGITVVQTYTDDKLPFENDFFDVIINRHESFDLSEVNRTLKRGGHFITQQVGNKNCCEFEQRLNSGFISHSSSHTINNYTDTLIEMGHQIIKTGEVQYSVKFFDVGALVYYAKIVVWNFPGFSVKTHTDKLFDCQKEIAETGFLQGTGHCFYIISQKNH